MYIQPTILQAPKQPNWLGALLGLGATIASAGTLVPAWAAAIPEWLPGSLSVGSQLFGGDGGIDFSGLSNNNRNRRNNSLPDIGDRLNPFEDFTSVYDKWVINNQQSMQPVISEAQNYLDRLPNYINGGIA